VQAVDQTPVQLRNVITTALKEYVTNPTVTVIVVEATAAMAYVMGEVNHPGTVNLNAGPMTVLQALAMVGGLKDFADAKNIRILRRSPTGVQTIPFNYKDAIRGSTPVYLQTGDTVVVPD
jgi:polysaccharide export outer membrane protein